MTRADILRRLAEGIARSCARAPHAHALHALSLLRALAREPGGAEAVAEALGLRAEPGPCDSCGGKGIVQGGIRRCRACDGSGWGVARIVAVSCPCHAGAVCGDACLAGAHHDGCAAPKAPTP